MIELVFGHGGDLGPFQMGTRAFVMFFVAIALIRIGGMRTFGRKSSLDSVVVIVLGSVLSRPIVGASPMFPAIIASLVLVVVHRIIAYTTASSPWLDRLIKGNSVVLYDHGTLDTSAMRRAGISHNDLVEAVHRHAHKPGLEHVAQVFVEASGELSIID